ncbi:hypothetical protein ACFORG_12885 [Lutimaribacter marinistellae]|uniref:LTXXQ motif family protein n=1 Tax=Lutimaribacter marinistellae TaxID=1820329 RepID=A0ABV7TH68_9RHOB
MQRPTRSKPKALALMFLVLSSIALAGPAQSYPYSPTNPDDGAGGVEKQGAPQDEDVGEPIDVTTPRFVGLSDFAVRELHRERQRGRTVRIGGFSDAMATWVLHMALADRRRTQRLIRDMRDLEKPEDRQERLNTEMERARDFERNLEQSIERLREREQWGAVSEERRRLRELRDFIEGLEVWVEHPWEGSR